MTFYYIRENLAAGVFEVLETSRQRGELGTADRRVGRESVLGLALQQTDIVQRFDWLIEPVLCAYILESAV